MLVREKTYQELALTEDGKLLELHHGGLREKPPMSIGHNRSIYRLDRQLMLQLDPAEFEIRVNSSRVRRTERTYYVPDLAVIPVDFITVLTEDPEALEVYDRPLPLVVETWSPSTGLYDVNAKLPEYQRRGDAEIWRLHPFDHAITAWRRQPDGRYDEFLFTEGSIEPIALPGVRIDLDQLFRR